MAREVGEGHSKEVNLRAETRVPVKRPASGGLGRKLQAGRVAFAKALRQECTWHVQGTKRRPCGWSLVSTGGGDRSEDRDMKEPGHVGPYNAQ